MTYRELVEEYYYSFDYWDSIEEFAKEYKINNLKYFKGLVKLIFAELNNRTRKETLKKLFTSNTAIEFLKDEYNYIFHKCTKKPGYQISTFYNSEPICDIYSNNIDELIEKFVNTFIGCSIKNIIK